MATIITRERPDTADAAGLIMELEAVLEPLYPSESRHGFSVERLIAQGVAFFVLRNDGAPAACGGVKLEDELRGLASLLKIGGRVATSTGFGGMGKTRLAVELVHRYGAYFAFTTPQAPAPRPGAGTPAPVRPAPRARRRSWS